MTVEVRIIHKMPPWQVVLLWVIILTIPICIFHTGQIQLDSSTKDKSGIGQFEILQRSDLIVHVPINIAGNVQLDNFCAGNGTDGSALKPHVISGFQIDASGSTYAIQVNDTTRFVVLENNALENYKNPYGSVYNSAGVLLRNASNILVKNNTFQKNFNGITILSSSNVTITNNTIVDSVVCGVAINNSGSINASSNSLWNCGLYVEDCTLPQLLSYNIDTTNKVNANGSIHYLKNINRLKVDYVQNGSQVFLVNCTNVEVSGIHFGSSTIGLMVYYSADITVRSNTFEKHNFYGFVGVLSRYLSVINNRISGALYGLGIKICNQTDIEYNVVFNNAYDGIVVGGGSQTRIIRNEVTNNTNYNIKIILSNNTSIIRNTVSKGRRGVGAAWDDVNVTISCNSISYTTESAVEVEQSDGIVVSSNQFSSNMVALRLKQEVSNFIASLNNFVNSISGNVDIGGNANATSWNCTGWGNYWDDYAVHYPNATAAANGTWMTPYNCTWSVSNFTDYRPLVSANIIPWIEFQVEQHQWRVGVPVTFTFSGSSGDGPIEIRWDFGDGQFETSSFTVQHVYSQPGHYGVSLSIRDRHGETDYLLLEDFIEISNGSDDGSILLGIILSLCIVISIPAVLLWIGMRRRRREKKILQSS